MGLDVIGVVFGGLIGWIYGIILLPMFVSVGGIAYYLISSPF